MMLGMRRVSNGMGMQLRTCLEGIGFKKGQDSEMSCMSVFPNKHKKLNE